MLHVAVLVELLGGEVHHCLTIDRQGREQLSRDDSNNVAEQSPPKHDTELTSRLCHCNIFPVIRT